MAMAGNPYLGYDCVMRIHRAIGRLALLLALFFAGAPGTAGAGSVIDSKAALAGYQGWSLGGFAEHTFCRGKHIVDDYRFVGSNGWGRFLPRKTAGKL